MHSHTWRRDQIEVTSFSSIEREFIVRGFECTGCGATAPDLNSAVYEAIVDSAIDGEQIRLSFADHKEVLDSIRR